MAKGRELKSRIKSVENTRKITRTMEMVATSKMKRAQDRVSAARPYAQALRDVIASLYSPDLAERFPLLRQPSQPRRAAVILLTANRGLAGAFNANLIKEARATIARLEREGVTVDLHAVGRKGVGYFRYVGRAIASSRTDITDRPTAENAADLVNDLTDAFARGEIDAVYVIYPNFKTVLSAPPATVQVLPVQPPASGAKQRDYILAPDAQTILVLRRAADGDEERDGQRDGHAQDSGTNVQSRAPGDDHAGDRRDRRRRRRAAGVIKR
jgi:F-type H+-transporting ATPase subunit gamma